LSAMPPAMPTAAAPTATAGPAALPAALLTVSTTPLPSLRLLSVECDAPRFDPLLEPRAVVLRFAPLLEARDRLLEDRAGLRAAGLGAVDFLVPLDRFVLLRCVLAAIEFSSSGVPCVGLALPDRHS
jgi:hypothetical protein